MFPSVSTAPARFAIPVYLTLTSHVLVENCKCTVILRTLITAQQKKKQTITPLPGGSSYPSSLKERVSRRVHILWTLLDISICSTSSKSQSLAELQTGDPKISLILHSHHTVVCTQLTNPSRSHKSVQNFTSSIKVTIAHWYIAN